MTARELRCSSGISWMFLLLSLDYCFHISARQNGPKLPTVNKKVTCVAEDECCCELLPIFFVLKTPILTVSPNPNSFLPRNERPFLRWPVLSGGVFGGAKVWSTGGFAEKCWWTKLIDRWMGWFFMGESMGKLDQHHLSCYRIYNLYWWLYPHGGVVFYG